MIHSENSGTILVRKQKEEMRCSFCQLTFSFALSMEPTHGLIIDFTTLVVVVALLCHVPPLRARNTVYNKNKRVSRFELKSSVSETDVLSYLD
jgi:hypothetical protein